jgi:hypothetical protein
MGALSWMYVKEYGQDDPERGPGRWRKPLSVTRAYAPKTDQLDKPKLVQNFTPREAQIAMLRRALARGDTTLEQMPEWARPDAEPATAPAPEPVRFSTHVERRLSRSRERAVQQEKAQERVRVLRVEMLAEAWGCSVRVKPAR